MSSNHPPQKGRPARLVPPAARRRGERGNTLILGFVTMAILATMAAGAITMSGVELSAAASKKQSDMLAACARGGRDLLMSQFRLTNAPPTSMKAVLPGTSNDLLIASGHYNSTLPSLSLEIRSPQLAGTQRGVEDIANKMTGGSSTAPATYTIVCQDQRDGTQARQYELEFTVQFGF